MLAHLVSADERVPGADVLDVCTGSGVIAVLAARAGARSVTAVDLSRRAVLAARLNAARARVRVQAVRGSLFDAVPGRRFDVIAANPPYLPSQTDKLPERGPGRAWEAGRDGRVLLDQIIAGAPGHLRPGGVMWLVHSSVCGVEETLTKIEDAGLDAVVVESRRGPLGPLLASRAGELEASGLLAVGEREENVVAIRATTRRPAQTSIRTPARRAPG